MSQIKFLGILFVILLLVVPLSAYGQQGSRDIMKEYCLNNWQRDPAQCADYVPEDYDEKKAEYSAQEAERARQEVQQIIKPAQESKRVCPLGSRIGTDDFGNQVCLDSKTNQFVSYPNTGQGDFGDNNMIIVVAVVIIMIIIGGIAVARRKTTESTVEPLPRRGWTDAQHKEILRRQNGVCARCGEYSGSYQFDHIDDNRYNNDIDNAQALCPNCHDRKNRGLN